MVEAEPSEDNGDPTDTSAGGPVNPEVRCDGCGRTPEQGTAVIGDGAPWTWSRSVDEHGRTLLCVTCAREHARSIEAKLGPDWW